MSGSLGKLTRGVNGEEPGQGGEVGGEEGQTQNYSDSWAEKEYPLFREEGDIKEYVT